MTTTHAPGAQAPSSQAHRAQAPGTQAHGSQDHAPRLLWLDGLRFVAAFAVVIYHFAASPTAGRYWGADPVGVFPLANQVGRYGWLSVELFFMLSGFVILMSAQGRSIPEYIGSRVGRLFPAFWAAVVATAILQFFWDGGRNPGFRATLLNFTMVPDLFGVQPVQVVFWTLLAELKFYVLVGILLAVTSWWNRRQARKAQLRMARASSGAPGDTVPPPHLRREFPEWTVVAFAVGWPAVALVVQQLGWTTAAEWLVAPYAPYFGIGMLLYLLRRYRQARLLIPLAITVGMGVYHLIPRAQHAHDLQEVPVSVGMSIAIMLLAVLWVWQASSAKATIDDPRVAKILVTAGALTYPLYLIHTQFGFLLIDVLYPQVSDWTTLGITVLACGVLAWVIHLVAEKRFSKPLRLWVTARLSRRWPLGG
ncbi:MAG: acyltransferase [Cellulomonadaceae bacterium]|jgi:peptidoglycan/LPS O-acetylase OafA/YrhL|nr:acyltransferase [Cellulomonadaceae bacterium]